MHRSVKGFTLIELMIVIAIIAILMSYALPAYRDYLVRVKAAEGINLTGSLKANISEFWMNTGDITPLSSGTNGIPAAVSYQGNYVERINVNSGVIQVVFNNDPALTGNTLTFTPVTPGSAGNSGASLIWLCSSTLVNNYLPNECRSP